MHVPGWHEATKKWQEDGKLQMAGIIEEQHPDRAQLFMEWKHLRWPVLVDALNLLGVSAVPVTLAIDEYGVIRMVNPKPEEIGEKFVNRTFEKPSNLPAVKDIAPDLPSLKQAARLGTAEAWETYANALVEWAGPDRLGEAIQTYDRALSLERQFGPLHFRLGVAYRKRYDSPFHQPEDFQKAVDQWSAALELDPNQYIWRRRIQQYGPRLDKPYPFYDWVTTARKEIGAPGQVAPPTPAGAADIPTRAPQGAPLQVYEWLGAARSESGAQPDQNFGAGRLWDSAGWLHRDGKSFGCHADRQLR